MKVLHAVHNFPPEFVGGTEAYVRALSLRQSQRGLEVVVVSGSERPAVSGAPGISEERGEGIRVLRLHRDVSTEQYSVDLELPRITQQFRLLIQQEQPDVVHVHHYQNLGARMVTAAAEAAIPAIVTLHDFLSICPRFFLIRPDGGYCGDEVPIPFARCLACCQQEFAGDRGALESEFTRRRAFFDQELEAAATLIAPSAKTAATLKSAAILRTEPAIEVLPHGLLEPLSPRSGAGDTARPAALRLAFFGNVAPVKGVDLLLDAVRGLPDPQRDRVRLTILGPCTDEALSGRIEELRAGLHCVRENGFDRARLERLASESDLAVFPGVAAETYSLVVDEALALGLGVIVSDRGAAAERAGGAGLVVRTGDVDHLRQTIRSLLDEPSRVRDLRDAASAQAFTVDDNAARLEEIYRAAIRGAGGAGKVLPS